MVPFNVHRQLKDCAKSNSVRSLLGLVGHHGVGVTFTVDCVKVPLIVLMTGGF